MSTTRVGFVVHGGRPRSISTAMLAAGLLRDAGIEVFTADTGFDPDAAATAGTSVASAKADLAVRTVDAFGADVDLVVAFGGDGTFLRAAHLSRDHAIGVLGINLGRLGFLADAEVHQLEDTMHRVATGDVDIEHRTTLDIEVLSPSGKVTHRDWALNEVSVEKTARQRLVHLELFVGEERFATFPADALVLATATGSTAYSLSAGGPIVSPRLDVLLVTAVAPHSLFDRTLVAAPDEDLTVGIVADQDAPAVVSCDGRDPTTVPPGGRVRVRGGGDPVVLARVHGVGFYTLVRTKFGLR